MKSILLFLSLFFVFGLQAQFDLSGTIKSESGETLVSASVFLRDSEHATISDDNGYWILRDVPAERYELKATYLGFKSHTQFIDVIDDENMDIILAGSPFNIDEIEIKATQIAADGPFPNVILEEEDIEKSNFGQDIPFLLRYTPSAVVTSDAGAGIGYTGIRIRGSDASRINVTINGVPLNDSESQSVFWVNLPDFGSSISSLQIQRGVGTSTNGSGAFGGTVSLNTNQVHLKPYAEFNSTYGSFNTTKLNVQAGTGLMNDKYTIDLRFSQINSDGYIDRATSDLSSWYVTAAKIGENSMLRLNAFSGHEITYQSWFGAPIERVSGTEEELRAHYDRNAFPGGLYQTVEDSLNLFNSDRRYNYYTYENEVDNYEQSHYQLIYDKQINENLTWNSVLHYTRGKGFFEQFRIEDEFADYRLDDFVDPLTQEVFTTSDLVRRRWLDNHYFGGIVNLKQNLEKLELTYGGAFHHYIGDHFGQVVWAERDNGFDKDEQFYFNQGNKSDYNAFVKATIPVGDKAEVFADLQYRGVNYSAEGEDIDFSNVNIDTSLNFFNPKLGISYNLSNRDMIYASVAVANREPDRNDFIDQAVIGQTPDHENLTDYELGWRSKREKINWEVNAYFMDYKNQLVLTGELNDVGSSLRTNVADSYRAGIELSAGLQLTDKLAWYPNLTLSQNKISSFDELIYDYTNGEDIITTNFQDTDISFSPSVIGGSSLIYKPIKNLETELRTKYVSRQFLDNTSDETKAIDAYFVNDVRLTYDLGLSFADKASVSLVVNNVLNELYSANGYTYTFIFGDTITERYLYPQAETNFLLSLMIRFQ
jgi:iron complex outermembrane receptor protein